MENILRIAKKAIPKSIFTMAQPFYHYALALLGAIRYRFPGRKLYVIGVTGTKGKSSTTEIISAILEEAQIPNGLLSTIRFKTNKDSKRNLFKMTIPGRVFVQKFLKSAHGSGATHVVIEMTSEGAKQFRQKFIPIDALVVTNIFPEHIESHGSFEKYVGAKRKIAEQLSRSKKLNKAIIVNTDNDDSAPFLETDVENKIPVTLHDVSNCTTYPSISFTYKGVSFTSPLQGEFNVYNLLSAIKVAEHVGIDLHVIQKAVEKFKTIPGRVEHVNEGQDFDVIVDYAHTKDSLEALYSTFKTSRKICVLGNTGGGRDAWKRPEMAKIAEHHCETVILTNEDPYDEDPKKIIDEMAAGMTKKPLIIIDRREAIEEALKLAHKGNVVLITGKGTDPYIMGPRGTKEKWSDREVARDSLTKMLRA